MSTIGKSIQDNGVTGGYELTEFMDLDDDERLERSLLDACIMAENFNKRTEKQLESTTVKKNLNSGDKNEENAMTMTDGSVDENHDVSVENGLKMEFSCSPERLVEPNMDYTLDEVIEIHTISDEEDDDLVTDVVSTIFKEQKTSNDKEVEKSAASHSNALNDDDDNEELLTVFNDHNYMSQEITTPAPDVRIDLRQNMIDHIVKKRSLEASTGASGICDEDSCSSNDSAIEDNAKKEIEDFVDQILEGKIKNFVNKEIKSEAIHTEDFVQNVIYAVADEDAAEYAAEESLSYRKQKEAESETGSEKVPQPEATTSTSNALNINAETENADNKSQDGTESCSFRSCSELDFETIEHQNETENSISKPHQNDSVLRMETSDDENCQLSANASGIDSNSDSTSNGKEDRSQLGSNATLPEYCSEPLEVIPLDERFEMAIEEEIEIPFGEDVERNEASFLDNLLEQFENDSQQLETPTVDVLPQLKENTAATEGSAEKAPERLENAMSGAEITLPGSLDQLEKSSLIPQDECEGNSPERPSSQGKTGFEKNKILMEADDQQLDTVFESSLETNYERLDRAMQEAETLCLKSSILEEFTVLVKEMHDDCEKFSVAATNIDSRLGTYIMDKLEIMRELMRRCGSSFAVTERASQTETKLSRRRLRKLNKKDKRALLASTDSSSCVGSSSSDGHISSSSDEIDKPCTSVRLPKPLPICRKSDEDLETKNQVTETKQDEPDFGEIASSHLSQVSAITEGVYDDGVNLTKYLLSDVFSTLNSKTGDDKTSNTSTPTRSRSSSSSSTSDNDTANSKAKPSRSKEKTEHKATKKEATADKDKEIERLINLDGLMKRHNNAGGSKQADIDKQKTKSQIQKNKTDGVLEFLENDLAKESLSSEESANENEEEVITEKQYLERYNQDLKKQLLNDSSNDTSQDEEGDEEFVSPLSDESESGNRSPLVDKFLKTYNIDDSEEEDTEMASDEIPVKDTSATTISKCDDVKKPDDDQTSLKKEENQEKCVTNTSDNSDCELLNDNFIYRKRTQPKSLEKILNEAEKRKKIQKLDEDLISLSSESDCSDVEAVEIETAEIAKSRAIKPMLRPDQLQRETVKAQKSEAERIRRLEKRQVTLARVLAENKDLSTDEELVLDYNEETKTFIKVHSGLVKHLKPHQREGVRFMYDSCYGGVDTAKKNHGSGCILAHCMGLGKTLQLIALMHTVISYKELKTQKILVLCPKSTVMNWGDEIARWLFPLRTRNLKVYTFNDTSDINEKLSIMRDWSQSTYQKAGCLLIGYEAFRTLVFYHTYKNRNNLDSTRLEKIRNLIDEYLLQPGADLVVCDEGHIIKNSKSAISLAVAEIKTQKRIVLTGTPIQNNLKEYYSMVNFIKPLFLGTEKEFANLYANPIKNGQHKDSNKRDIKIMKQRSFVLHKKLSKFVQRKEAELLKSFLPKKFEYVLFIPMTNVQNKLYERILETIKSRQDNRGRGLITDYTCLRKIWTHPKVLEDAWKNAISQQFRREARKQANSDDDQPDDIYDSQTGFMSVKNDWWRNLIDEKDLESILPSNKLRTMFEILRMCEENGDKCLIFSAFVAVLNVVEYFFKKLAEGHKETMSELNMSQGFRSTWESNKDYFRLDGKTPKSTRHEMIKRFNHPNNTRSRVFLISAKAGGQGINLIGANRVIILDTSWNPSNDQQNIFRIFRLGQKKNCYIYRLLALGTMEEKVYSRSVTKQAMSFRVMDVQQIDRHYSMAELAELYTLTIPNYAERPTPIFPQDTILANLLRSFPDLVYKYHEHDSLLENKVEQELSEQEKIDAWNAYENDLQMNSQMANVEDMQNKMAQGNMQNYMGAGGSIPGLNLQALLNFRGMNAQANSPYLNSSLLQQYKYNMANQQYLDMVNSYRQYSTPEAAAAFNASVAAAYSSINSSIYPGGAPSVSPHLTSSANLSANTAAHPLSALNDLSMYGLGINSSTSAAAAAAAAVATSLAQLPSTSNNNSSMYATPGMQTQPVSAAGLYPNQTASFYQTLQQLGYVGATTGNGNMLNNSALNSFTNNSAPFQAPRQTPPQSASRKSSTPDLTGYRNSSGSVSMSTATPTTSSLPLSTTSMVSTPTKSNELPKSSNLNNIVNSNSNSNSNINVNSKSSSDLMNSGSRRVDVNSNKAVLKPTPTSSNSTMSIPNKNTITRTETTSTVSNNRQITTPTTVSSVTSTNKTSMPSKNLLPRISSKAPTSNSITPLTTKTADPQIRVKDMGQLCANINRGPSLQTAAAAVARESAANNYASNSTNNNAVGRNKQSGVDNRLTTQSSASATELLKARSEMQIIPTTSPPGTASISKQLSEISPSISLTAVRNTNVKPSSTTSSNFSKISGVNTSTTNNSKISPATITPSMLTNRQQIAASNVQPRKNITHMNAIGLSNSNLSVSMKKPGVPNAGTATSSSNVGLPTKKTVIPMPQSNVTMTTASSNSLNTTSIIGTKATIAGLGKNNSNNNFQYISESAARANLAKNASTLTRITTSASGKNTPSILRSHHIRKMPSPLPTTAVSSSNIINNINTSINASTSSNQPSSIVNTKPTLSNNTKTVVASTGANAAQLLYTNKINSSVRRSYSPTTITQRTSRTASPANSSTVSMEKNVSNNSNKGNTVTVAAPTTSAFPVHLQRSNSALGRTRTLSPLSTVKASASGLGNRTKSSTAIVSPRIASVTSLNTSTVSTPAAAATSSLSSAAAAAIRAAAFKKLSITSGKINLQNTKHLQPSSALKVAAAKVVVQQKRPIISGIVGSSTTIQPQQQPQKQRISIQSNGRPLNVVPTRTLPGDTRIGGVNIRPILKGVTTLGNSGPSLQSADKRTPVGSQISSASGQAVEKLLLERKRKASEITGKEGGSLSKRPKDS